MVISGWLSIIVWCGAYGISEIVGVLKTWKVLCLISSCSFLEHYWIGYQSWRAFPFFYCWFIRFMQFCNWLFTPLYFLCTWAVYLYISITPVTYFKKQILLFTMSESMALSIMNAEMHWILVIAVINTLFGHGAMWSTIYIYIYIFIYLFIYIYFYNPFNDPIGTNKI